MRYVLYLLLVGVGLTSACHRKISTPGQTPTTTLRVLCYNIHHANPPEQPNVIDLDAIAAVIRNAQADVVMLQEVDVRTGRSGKQSDQAADLAAKTNLNPYFIKAIDHDGGDYGVAILSKYPMTNLRRFPLPTDSTTRGERRVLGLASITLPNGKSVTLACTHLDAQRASTNRVLQATAIANQLRQEKQPVVLAGDFNDTPESEPLRILTNVVKPGCAPCAPTIPVENPNKTIDFITFAPQNAFQVREYTVIPERKASDHLPVLAVLAIP